MKEGNFQIVKGDIFKLMPPGPKIIAHVVNNIGAWGKGFTAALHRYFPSIKMDYLLDKDSQKRDYLLGTNIYTNIYDSVYVANMIAQDGLPCSKNPQPLRYSALIQCMIGVEEFAELNKLKDIHCPKFGSGLAGGNWKVIKKLIEEIWIENGLNITVYQL